MATTAVTATQLHAAATARLDAEIDAHWRGAYDILVLPRQTGLDLASTSGLVEPDFVALSGTGGITVAQWQAVTGLPDVEVAAPIGWVGFVTSPTTKPSIEITAFPSTPAVFEATVSVTTFDGIAHRLVYEQTQHVLLGPSQGDSKDILALSDGGDVLIGTASDGSPIADIATEQAPPQVQSPILAVDPTSEMKLLGGAGRFLAPLADLRDRDSLTTLNANPQIVLPGYNERLDIAILKRRKIDRPVLPVLVSSRTYTPLEISLSVVRLGDPVTGPIDVSRGAAAVRDAVSSAGPNRSVIGTSSVEVSADLRALRLNSIVVGWPGSTVSGTGGGVAVDRIPEFTNEIVDRPSYVGVSPPPGFDGPTFRVEPRGLVPPGGPGPAASQDPTTKVGTEQSYRSLRHQGTVATRAGTDPLSEQPFMFAPLAEYDLNQLHLPADPLAYVPYGAYDEPDTTLVALPDGTGRSSVALSPTLNPTGLLTVPPMGIVDIHAAGLIRGSTPIDAIRVRVGDIRQYGTDALDRVARVAAAIDAMGLDATVVAASSPQTVEIAVPAYDTSIDPPGDLGYVQQHWTTLGAAPLVDQALGDTNRVLLILAILEVMVMVLGTEVLTAAVRTDEARIFSSIGWGRWRIVRWQAAESVVAGAMVGLTAFAAWMVSGGEMVGLVVGAAAVVIYLAAGVLGAIVVRSSDPRSTEAGAAVRWTAWWAAGLARYALRSTILRPWRLLASVVGIALSAATIAPAAALVATSAARVGPTMLGAALAARLGWFQLALVGLIGLGALAFGMLSLRIDFATDWDERRILAATGWRPAEVRRAYMYRRIFVAIPAAVLAATVALGAVPPLIGEASMTGQVAAAAGLLAFSVVPWGSVAYRGLA